MTGPLTPTIVTDLETRIRVITEQSYDLLTRELWWQAVTKELSSVSKTEVVTWLLDSAVIEYVNRFGGEVEFADILAQTTNFTALAATAGLKLNRAQLEDHDGNGVQLAAHWARTIGQYAAYWPQKQVAAAIRDGAQSTSLAYDGQVFFSAAHPLNPFDTSLGTYDNDIVANITATPSEAFAALQAAFALIRAVKMPNGEDPRGLRPRQLIVPPALQTIATQLTSAKFIAQAAASIGGGSADVDAVIAGWQLAPPIVADELGAGYTNGSDTTFYIATAQIAGDDLGALTYVNREPFSVVFNGEMTDAELARRNELQWITRGRNIVGYGHPYLLWRCTSS
jgi:phage major head subunit gpT-like protein